MVTPYIVIGKGALIVINESSTEYAPPQPEIDTPPTRRTAGAPLHAPFEQLVYVDAQTLLIAPQLLKSIKRLTHEPNGCRT